VLADAIPKSPWRHDVGDAEKDRLAASAVDRRHDFEVALAGSRTNCQRSVRISKWQCAGREMSPPRATVRTRYC
jgi:hypothetical protein